MQTAILNDYVRVRDSFVNWQQTASVSVKVGLALVMAAVTGLLAQIVIPLPFTPVPVTGQTLAVLLAGVLLGHKWGGLSQIFYVGFGTLGLPWFAGLSGGFAVFAGPTAGYLIGFVLAAFFLGFMVRKKSENGFFSLVGLMWFASFALIQVPGLMGLALWSKLSLGSVPALPELLSMGMLPFVPGDVVKILLAASLAKALLFKAPKAV